MMTADIEVTTIEPVPAITSMVATCVTRWMSGTVASVACCCAFQGLG